MVIKWENVGNSGKMSSPPDKLWERIPFKMFVGEYNYSFDDKGRVIIPADFRTDLKGTIYVLKGFEKCLYVYDEQEWKIQKKRYSGLSDFNKESRHIKRLIFSGMIEVSPDKNGRIKISQQLLDYAQINKEVVIVGVNDHLEIWPKEKWSKFIDEYQESLEDLAEKIGKKIQED